MRFVSFQIFFLSLFLVAGSVAAEVNQAPGAHAVASAHPLATEAGLSVLEKGGNAFDAAVAVTAMLAVVEPTGSGLGGGGFWLLHRAKDGKQIFLDGREMAPGAAHENMYLDADGKVNPKASLDGPLAAGIPGEPAAMEHLAAQYGRLKLAESLAPAIRVAREGYDCDARLAFMFKWMWPRFNAEAKRIFSVDGNPPEEGDRIVQPELAEVLSRIAASGASGFYEGKTAEALIAAVKQDGGIWTPEDLRRYKLVEREPVVTRFRDIRIVTAPPPSAGGITMAEIFGQLQWLGWSGEAGIASRHLLVEAMRRAYRDRAAYLGDPDYVEMPMEKLLSESYARELAASIDQDKATPSADLVNATVDEGGEDTTHFSIIDALGNRVAATLSINFPFGSGFVAPGTGVFLNNEMDDFSASTTATNAYGLIGSHANRVQAGKRPLSSMSPTFAEGPRGVLIIGTPGGSRIITMVLNGILEWAEGGTAKDAVELGRFHHQYLPDLVQYEPGALSDDEIKALESRGHVLKARDRPFGNMQAIWWRTSDGTLEAASDPRGVGRARVVKVEAAATAK